MKIGTASSPLAPLPRGEGQFKPLSLQERGWGEGAAVELSDGVSLP